MPSHLKSLELHGYKTFASRTLFEFADTITAIVGPNGSGKSNIADSLRWVLGEQSYSLLRGKKTEDMIFSGSEHRSRASMASASVTFDNSDGWLPIDFNEVEISRRAYRDGQNEYLINKQRVRLKDVSELLAQSGLAERTYTIIGQGLVDAALALKAEERRRLFEEAAGTGLHRSRREEALRRLEATQRNLERVQDIMAELHPRLRSLERQARRAQEYEQIKSDLRVLLREWYGYHWHHSQRELSSAQENARSLEVALQLAQDEQRVMDEKLADLRDRNQSLRASLNSWHRQSAQLHTRREALSRELAVAEERMRSLVEQRHNADVEINRLEEELRMHQAKLSETAGELARLEGEQRDAQTQLQAAKNELAARQTERERIEKDVQSARQSLSAQNSRRGQLQARLAEREAQAERAEKQQQNTAQALAEAKSDLKKSEDALQEDERMLRKAKLAREQTEERYQTHQQKIGQVEAALKEISSQRSDANAELARIKARVDVLDQAEDALTGYAGGTRLLMQTSRNNKLNGLVGPLGSRLEVPANIETAVAAALGEYLDSVLIEGEPEPALDLLQEGAVRGVLLPLNRLKPVQQDLKQLGQDGVLGVASEMVRAPAELRPAVDLLLGQIIIVEDRGTARRLLPHLPLQMKIVTLKGEVFFVSGPVLSGGTGGEGGGQSVLSRQRQRRELRQEQGQVEQRLAELDQKIKETSQHLENLQVEGNRLVQSLKQERQEESQAAQAANQARLNADQAQRQVKWQQEQLDRLQQEMEQGEKDAERLKNDLAQIEVQIDEIRDRLRQLNTALNELILDEFQSQVNHWNTILAVSERALSDARTRHREHQANLERMNHRKDALQNRLNDLQESLQSLEIEKSQQKQEEANIGQEIESLRELIDPAEADLEAVEAEQNKHQTQDTKIRQKVSAAEHRHAQARIHLARRQESLESLRHRIEDDFGLVAFDYADDISGPTPLPLQGMVEELPVVGQLSPEIDDQIKRQRAQLRRMGAINPDAQAEYEEVSQRVTFLTEQLADLEKAEADVHRVIAELDTMMEQLFLETFDAVAEEFKQIFTRLFGGGSAKLVLTDPDHLTDTGIDIEARLPGRRTQGLSLLSGGERSLTATALVFSLLKVSPTPFCVLDEVDAMLDEANVGRFRELLRELSRNTQFVIVTHNRNTVQAADIIYGVTMGRDSASQVISLKLDEVASIID